MGKIHEPTASSSTTGAKLPSSILPEVNQRRWFTPDPLLVLCSELEGAERVRVRGRMELVVVAEVEAENHQVERQSPHQAIQLEIAAPHNWSRYSEKVPNAGRSCASRLSHFP